MDKRFKDQIAEIKKRQESLSVRFIKLGEGGGRVDVCVENNLLYLGFWTEREEYLHRANSIRTATDKKATRLAVAKHYQKHYLDLYQREQKASPESAARSMGTRAANTVMDIAEDSGNILWWTLHNRTIYYGLTDGGALENAHQFGGIGSAKKMPYGWCNLDARGEVLEESKLSGAFTKTATTRLTMAKIGDAPAEYFIKTVLGVELEFKQQALKAKSDLKSALVSIITDLRPSEFEVLVSLIFSNSGWRLDGEIGGNVKFVDVTLTLPSTRETAGVQVKTGSKKNVSQKYVDGFEEHNMDKFFYVYHSGEAKPSKVDNYFIWDVNVVADKVIDSGLVDWVIDRAYK